MRVGDGAHAAGRLENWACSRHEATTWTCSEAHLLPREGHVGPQPSTQTRAQTNGQGAVSSGHLNKRQRTVNVVL